MKKNALQNYFMFYDRYFHDQKNVYLILEYARNGELFKLMSRGNGIDEITCRRYMVQIASAVSYLHQLNVVHRDIKPENVLVGETGNLKIADFGSAAIVPLNRRMRFTMCGTPEYLSPEMIAETGHSVPVDYWALGVMMYEFMFSRTPFYESKKNSIELREMCNISDGSDIDDIAEKECRSRIYSRIRNHNGTIVFPSITSSGGAVSTEVREIVKRFLSPDPKRRMTADQFLASSWVNFV